MADSLRRPPPPPPPSRPTAASNGDTKSSKELQKKVEERMKENTDLRQLLNSLRLDQKERSNNPVINRPPPPPKGNGRGRGQIEKSEQMESQVGLSSKTPPKPLRAPFKTDSNGNVFQDANESKTEQNQGVGLVQPPKPLRSPNVVGKKENIRVADRIEKDFRVEQKVDEAVRNLILADQIPPPPKFDLMEYVKLMPHGDSKYIETTFVFEIKNIDRPIGIIVLDKTKTIVISEQGKNQVKLYKIDGSPLKIVQPGQPFRKPTDMVALKDGKFAVRDANGIQLFDSQGQYLKNLCEDALGFVFGLTTNEDGNIFTINSNSRAKNKEGNPTAKGEIDIIEIDVETNSIVRQIELADIIQDKKNSKCRFLHCSGSRLYIVDLGLNCVYILSLKDNTSVRKFGTSGKSDGQFRDPAGLVSDSIGNVILADAGNHRLQVFDTSRKFVCNVHIYKGLKRPSGIYLDQEEEALYVLNLNGNSMAKYALKKNNISS